MLPHACHIHVWTCNVLSILKNGYNLTSICLILDQNIFEPVYWDKSRLKLNTDWCIVMLKKGFFFCLCGFLFPPVSLDAEYHIAYWFNIIRFFIYFEISFHKIVSTFFWQSQILNSKIIFNAQLWIFFFEYFMECLNSFEYSMDIKARVTCNC